MRYYGKENNYEKVNTHRISAIIWLNYDLNSNLCVCHKCDNPLCFNPDHLFIGTRQDNIADMYEKGRDNVPKGENAGRAKLTEKEVKEIRELYFHNIFNQPELSKIYNIDQSQITRLINRSTWRSVD
jgi:hypothetical protein